MIDAHLLKEAIRANLHTLCKAAFPAGKFRYGEWRIGDVSGTTGDSLGIRLVGSKAGLWIDRATGQCGNFLDLVLAKFGFGFREAAEWVARTLGMKFEVSEDGQEASSDQTLTSESEVEPEEKSLRPPEPEPEPVPLSGDQLKRMALAAHMLSLEPRLFYTVLGQRPEISLDTIRGVALDGDLGFELHCGGYDLYGEGTGWITAPAVLFGYSYGLKARWRTVTTLDGKKIRPVRWIAGKPAKQSWRQSLLRSAHQTVCIYEGETDVLSALSVGVEEDETVLAVGLAAAQVLPDPKPFACKKIVIFPDPGEEGIRSSQKLRTLFEPTAGSVAIINGGLAK
jgi:hypothetical protein